MTLEDQISALLLEAAPLRCLPEMEQGELGAIVDRINALRALQAAGVVDAVEQEPKRGPGRPKKAAQ
jgi:hypothetical protein